MRMSITALVIMLLINIIADMLISRNLNRSVSKKTWLKKTHWAFSAFFYAMLLFVIATPVSSVNERMFKAVLWCLFIPITVYVPKYTGLLFFYMSRIPCFWGKRSWKRLTQVGFVIGTACFIVLWWSALITPNRLVINRVNVSCPRLPDSFNGLRILQFSDLHCGSFCNNSPFIGRLVRTINSQEADLIVFTGDMVNRRSEEIKPFLRQLKAIHAPLGVYAILGNHDYGDYYSSWQDDEARQDDVRRLISCMQDSLGWTVLDNTHQFIHVRNDSLAIIGVGNWNQTPGHKNYCNLKTAYPNYTDNNFKILLSHNPDHWEYEIKKHTDIDLTLSGHTHALQAMISTDRLHWSPAGLKYKQWGGLYESPDNRYLYVNIGCGKIGMPARIGATPEITVITLTNQ